MYISQTFGLIMVLFTTLLWGSWFQFIKKVGDWPVSAFMLWLYSFSFALISVALLFLKKAFVPDGVMATMKAMPGLCLFILFCGAMFAVGIQLQMMVVSKAGLIFSTSVTSLLGIPVGCFVSSFFGGIPENISVFRLVLGIVFLVAATMLCQASTRMRDRDQNKVIEKGDKTNIKYIILLLICALVFAPTYSLAMSLGTQTSLNSAGIPPVLLVWILSAGSFLGTLLVSGIRLSKNKQWGEVFARKNYKYIGIACLSGAFHYGGNLIHTIAIPAVSVAIAWPLGYLATVWQYLWGMARGEFDKAKKATWITLIAGVVFFVFALITFTMALYG